MTAYPPGSGPPGRRYTEAEALEIIAANRQGVLATVKRDGHPHLSNMMYLWDPEQNAVLLSSTASRVKVRQLRANPKAALHVQGADFFSYAVLEGEAEVSDVTTSPGDAAGRALRPLYTDVSEDDVDALFKQLVTDERVLITLKVRKAYGLIIEF